MSDQFELVAMMVRVMAGLNHR